MKKLLFILILIFACTFSYSQNSVEKWNNLTNRYEYFDSNGNMTAYKVYSSLRHQWETYNVQQTNYTPQSSFNTDLAERTLSTLQARYDKNLSRLKEASNNSNRYIYLTAKVQGYTYEDAKAAANVYIVNYHNKVMKGGYDLSSTSLTDELITFLANGADKINCDYFKYCD